MGNYISRRTGGVEELDLSSSNAFHYPPRNGCYFGSHFIMGGERFETVQPEMYLFGENNDLNFLGNRPSQFPYPIPQTGEPTLTLKSLINIRKDSIRLVRAPSSDASKAKNNAHIDTDDDNNQRNSVDNSSTRTNTRQIRLSSTTTTTTLTTPAPVGNVLTSGGGGGGDGNKAKKQEQQISPPQPPKTAYNIEFTFDTDVDCTVKIHYFASEDIVSGNVIYSSRESEIASDPYRYKKGSDQVFCQPSHVLEPAKYTDEEWLYKSDKDIVPIVIHCIADDPIYSSHSHSTFCVLERVSNQAYMLKPLKQKQCIDGLGYLLQEIYGIENKYAQYAKEDDFDESGCECVICMCDVRDTLILPCRHLCLCHSCADNLRYQASNCPICRSPFRALLQIRALQRTQPPSADDAVVLTHPASDSIETSVVNSCGGGDNISHHSNGVLASYNNGLPAGYEAISLIEALNGHQTAIATATAAREPREEELSSVPSLEAMENLGDVENDLQNNPKVIVKVRTKSVEEHSLHSTYSEEEQQFSSALSSVDRNNSSILVAASGSRLAQGGGAGGDGAGIHDNKDDSSDVVMVVANDDSDLQVAPLAPADVYDSIITDNHLDDLTEAADDGGDPLAPPPHHHPHQQQQVVTSSETDSSTVSSTSSGQALLTSHMTNGGSLDDFLDVPIAS